jgi:hypothetical protein
VHPPQGTDRPGRQRRRGQGRGGRPGASQPDQPVGAQRAGSGADQGAVGDGVKQVPVQEQVEAAQVGPDRQGAAGQGRADPDLLTACHTTTLA